MSGERFDYTSERQRHEKFVGREALLARLDELLVEDGPDRWVVVTGGPGMGCGCIPRHGWPRRCRGSRSGSSVRAASGWCFVQIDLDAPDSAADNHATVCAFWEGTAGSLGLDARFIGTSAHGSL